MLGFVNQRSFPRNLWPKASRNRLETSKLNECARLSQVTAGGAVAERKTTAGGLHSLDTGV